MTQIRALHRWQDLFPEGRHIYYEGHNPSQFVKEIKERFGFDPSLNNPLWGKRYQRTKDCPAFTSYSFDCPAEHLDAIYGSGRYPMGS
jgi:hypothetical protein